MRKALFAGVALAALWAPAARSQVPVTDIGAIEQLYQQYVVELKDAAVQLQQLQQAASQVEWAVQSYNSFVASPSLGGAMGLINAAGISNPLPVSPYTVENLIRGQGGLNGTLGALSSLSSQSFGVNHIYTPSDNSWISQQMAAKANSVASAQGIAQQVYGQMAIRFPIIQSLQTNLLSATTPAARDHIVGQIQSQQAWVQGAQGQMQTASLMLAAERDNREQRADEHMTQSIDAELGQARANGVIP